MRRTATTFVGLVVLCFTGLAGGQQPTPMRVFADLEHTGTLSGPLPNDTKSAQAFVIVAPLPANCAKLEVLSEPIADGENVALRLGRLRVEIKEGSDVALALHSDNTASIRLYQKTENGWQITSQSKEKTWTFKADKSNGFEVGIGVVMPEATVDSPEPNWPGAFTIDISPDVDQKEVVRVPFRTAPFIIPSPLDPVETLLIVGDRTTIDAVKSLEAFTAKTELQLIAHNTRPAGDQWMQDTIEPGVFPYPTGGHVSQAPAILTGLRKEFGRGAAWLDEDIATRCRKSGGVPIVAGVPRKNTRWIDWYGNLEVTPPHTDGNGRRYPFGRILTGKQNNLEMHPGVMRFLKSQNVQWPPVVVDTSWLVIGHVDEVVNFVPAKTETGFKALLPSPKAARELLDALIAKGHGELPVFEKSRDATTVRDLREQIAASKENSTIDETINGIRKQLQKELNLNDSDFVLLPVLFDRGGAVIANAVNSVVVNGHVLAPEQRGPRHNGKDLFEEAIRQSLVDCDVRVIFVDGWQAYHSFGGEIHCGTNAIRRLRNPAWWKLVENLGPAK